MVGGSYMPVISEMMVIERNKIYDRIVQTEITTGNLESLKTRFFKNDQWFIAYIKAHGLSNAAHAGQHEVCKLFLEWGIPLKTSHLTLASSHQTLRALLCTSIFIPNEVDLSYSGKAVLIFLACLKRLANQKVMNQTMPRDVRYLILTYIPQLADFMILKLKHGKPIPQIFLKSAQQRLMSTTIRELKQLQANTAGILQKNAGAIMECEFWQQLKALETEKKLEDETLQTIERRLIQDHFTWNGQAKEPEIQLPPYNYYSDLPDLGWCSIL